MPEVYITRAAHFFPNSPVSNDEMEEYLGMIDGVPSKGKGLTLRNNGIKTRYYALDKTGKSTHSNAKMTALAIEQLTDNDFKLSDIELLACGTASPDNQMPSHAVMVHGELKSSPVELISPSGSCCASMQAIKFGYTSILSGNTTNAVCTGSEKLSTFMQSHHFENETARLAELEQHPIIAFEKDFLRWMLSDGAGALLLQDKPNTKGISLKIEWLDIKSFANELDTCMYVAAEKNEDGSTTGWRDFTPEQWLQKSVFSFKQDTKLLGREIVPVGVRYLQEIIAKRNFDLNSITHFLPHLSSEFFRKKIADELNRVGLNIAPEKWFTNLSQIGNIGSASIVLMIEEILNSGKSKKGETILLMVPESARFSYAYCLLTVC